MRTDTLRSGTSIVELMAALTLMALLVSMVIGVCLAQMRLARVTAERAVSTDALRTTAVVLAGEARRMTRADVRAMGEDSIAVRSFRGSGIVCGSTMSGPLVRYSGDRLPDPDKDSVLLASGTASPALALLDSRLATGSCDQLDGETVLEWRVGAMTAPPAVLLLFESGSYHLTGRALRYRIGAAGRQPLTAEALAHSTSRFTAMDDRAIRFDIGADNIGAAPYSAYFAFPGRQ